MALLRRIEAARSAAGTVARLAVTGAGPGRRARGPDRRAARGAHPRRRRLARAAADATAAVAGGSLQLAKTAAETGTRAVGTAGDRRGPDPRRARPAASPASPAACSSRPRRGTPAGCRPSTGTCRSRSPRRPPRTSRRSAGRCAVTWSGSRASSGRRSTTSSAGCWSASTTGGSPSRRSSASSRRSSRPAAATQVFPQRQDHPADLEPLLAAVLDAAHRHRRGRCRRRRQGPAGPGADPARDARDRAARLPAVDQGRRSRRGSGRSAPTWCSPGPARCCTRSPRARRSRRSTPPPPCSRRWRSAPGGRCGGAASRSCAGPNRRTTPPSRSRRPASRPGAAAAGADRGLPRPARPVRARRRGRAAAADPPPGPVGRPAQGADPQGRRPGPGVLRRRHSTCSCAGATCCRWTAPPTAASTASTPSSSTPPRCAPARRW